MVLSLNYKIYFLAPKWGKASYLALERRLSKHLEEALNCVPMKMDINWSPI